MSIKEKLKEMREKFARNAVKAATAATLLSGTAAATSCSENDSDVERSGNKIEFAEGERTSVVFRESVTYDSYSKKELLLENGDVLHVDRVYHNPNGEYLVPGDTVTYDGEGNLKAVRYKDGVGKKVNFGKIGKISKDSSR